MTRKEFLDALADDIRHSLRDVYTKTISGKEAPVTVYENSLPIVTEDEDDESKFFPYAIVRLSDSSTEEDKPWKQSVVIILGAYDDDIMGSGYMHILTMIERITNRFLEEPLLDHKYRAEATMSTAIQDEDTYPFYFGAIEMSFNLPKIERRDEFS